MTTPSNNVDVPMKNPPFIVVEGLDGAGTTTQTRRVAEVLSQKGHAVDISCEPSDGPIGVLIRKMLSMEVAITDESGGLRPVNRETLALLFAADRLHHLEDQVEPSLASGAIAISDRYYHSSLVYQGDVDEDDTVDYGWVRRINERARIPDLTVFLEAPVELCLERLTTRDTREIYESQEKLARLETRYEEVMSFLEEEGQPILRLDASLSMEELTERIVEEVRSISS